jgi:hypothetical protein
MAILLAEALAARADLESSIRDIKARVAAAAVHADDEPSAAPAAADLLAELMAAIEASCAMTGRINRANNSTTMRFEGKTLSLMAAVLLRDEIKRKAEALRSALSEIEQALGKQGGYYSRRRGKDELRMVSDLPVADLRASEKAASARLRALDMEIQKANYAVTLVD